MNQPRISSSHTTLTQKVQKVLQCMKQFLGSVATSQYHPEVPSLVVGGLNCILTVSFYFSISTVNLLLSDSLEWGALRFLRALRT